MRAAAPDSGSTTMSNLDFYGLEASDDFDEFDEFDFEDTEGDSLTPVGAAAGGYVGEKVGSGLGGALGTGLYDASTWAGRKALDYTGLTKYQPVQWYYDNVLNPDAKIGSTLRSAQGSAGAILGGVTGLVDGGAIGGALFEDADPFEPEYAAEDIDHMEALAEEAVEAEGEDAVIAADEMVSRSFGVMRASPRMRPIIAALRGQVQHLVMLAKRNPRYRVPARLAPIALRRTAAILMRMATARRPVSQRVAMTLFGRVLAQLARAPQTRAVALRQAQVRARRHRMRQGVPAPVAARRPVAAAPRAMRRLARSHT
jgi:hypothetical protein